MAKVKGNNKITLSAETLCEIVGDWLNSGGPFAKIPVTVTEAKGGYAGEFEFTFEQDKPDKGLPKTIA